MILDLMLLAICISGFEHCGISLSRITRPTLHYKLSFTVIYVTSKVVLMCKRVTPRYLIRQASQLESFDINSVPGDEPHHPPAIAVPSQEFLLRFL